MSEDVIEGQWKEVHELQQFSAATNCRQLPSAPLHLGY